MTETAIAVEPDTLLREAYEINYRFPPGFPGFRCELRVRGGEADGNGTAVIAADTPPRVDVELPESELQRLRHELASLAGHRFHRDYEDADGAHEKRLEDDENPAGRLVTIADAMDSSYRVGGGSINEITRTHGGSRFTIVIQARETAPDGRRLSTAFTVCHWSTEDGRLLRAEAYEDRYTEVAGVLLPSCRRVSTASDGGLVVREIRLEGHELLVDPEEVR